MKEIIDVHTGEVAASAGKVILKASALGSCVALAAYDVKQKVGGLAHVMLPGSAPKSKQNQQETRYAANAIEEMLGRMTRLGTNVADIEVSLVGGGNVLNKKDDTICQENIDSTIRLLNEKRITIRAQAVGSNKRRSVSLDVERGIISYTEADDREKLLWAAGNTLGQDGEAQNKD